MITGKPKQLTEDFTLETFLPYQVAVLAENMSRAFSHVYRQRFGITIPEWRILAQLHNHSPLSARELGALTNMDKPRVSRALVRLTQANLILRASNKKDRRVAVIKLSRKGKQLVEKIIPQAVLWQRDLENNLTKSVTDELAKLCHLFTSHFIQEKH